MSTSAENAALLAERLFYLADQLEPGECLPVCGADLWIARSRSGKVRVAFGWTSLYWPRGDAATLVGEHLAGALDWTVTGHFATRARHAVEGFLDRPVAHRIDGIGKVQPVVDRDPRCLRLAVPA
jgi:hypothetical protein